LVGVDTRLLDIYMPLITNIKQYNRTLTLEDFILESDKLYYNLTERDKNFMISDPKSLKSCLLD